MDVRGYVRVLGPISVDGAEISPRDGQVLGVLVVRSGSLASEDDFGEAVWAGRPPATFRKVVQGCIVRLRRLLGVASIISADRGYSLAPTVSTDARKFEEAYEGAVADMAAGFSMRAVVKADAALSTWRSTPLPDLNGWLPAESECERWQDIRESAIDLRLSALHAAGHAARAADDGAGLCAAAPLREVRWAAWARSLYSAGRPSEALDALARLRRALADELGVDPSEPIAELERAILRHDASLDVADASVTGVRAPWPGLRSYGVGDAEYFFGRQDDIDQLVAELSRDGGRLVLVSASGAGKSSLLHAGVVPALRAAGKTVLLTEPARLETDSASLADVIIIDQAEQVLVDGTDRGAAGLAMGGILASPASVAVAVRSDKVDELCGIPGFDQLPQGRTLLLRQMGDADLRLAIERPAEAAGARTEPGLADVIIAEGHSQPGILPLLSHALAETWSNAEGNLLTIDGYRRTGGLGGAVALSAERMLKSLTPQEVDATRTLFRRLVSEDGDLLPSWAPRDAVSPKLLEKLAAARIITITDDGDLRLAHEQLIRSWPRLSTWIEQDRAGRRLLRNLAHDAREWQASSESDGNLYRGARLQSALEWAEAHAQVLTGIERRFLEISSLNVNNEIRRTQRQNRRLRVALAATGVLLLAAATGALLAVEGRLAAVNARTETIAALAASESLRLGGLAETERDPAIAFALVAQSLTTDDSSQSRQIALEVFDRFATLLPFHPMSEVGNPPASTDAGSAGSAESADGSRVALTQGRSVVISDAAKRTVSVTDEEATRPSDLTFDAEATRLAGALNEPGFADTGTAVVWDVDSGLEVARVATGAHPLNALWFSADGEALITATDDGERQWDLSGSRAVVRTQDGTPTAFRTKEFVLAVWDSSSRVWTTAACDLAGRNLTRGEWRSLVGTADYDPAC
ncbi:BTAD domain-containing putative transcriptional regulator [Aeromicrobium sp.]|uniref:nSTAND1 domain-containing NTPase n=1 Tax=Aeromicrobium sp. TaxID=1871063 RepID=UPI0019ABBFB6|nr:BTAD domain-containing putative transcriptional regulator [Aeromicrobium sp.]MBC7633496.1 hypothetical protein [Aeromicrobium sp.]